MPTSDNGFTFHERSGWGAIVAGICVVIAGEAIGVHLLVRQWSAIVAWVLTLLDIYGIVWLINDYRALNRERTTIDRTGLHVRYGKRWVADVPLEAIESIEPIAGEWRKQSGALKLAMLDAPRLLIRLREPVQAIGLGLIKRSVDSIAVLPDDAEGFEASLREELQKMRERPLGDKAVSLPGRH